MKKQILAVCLLTLIGCTKLSTPDVSTDSQALTSPNATETSLMGTWHLQKQVITNPSDTITYTGYSAAYYITFRYGQLDPSAQYSGTYCKNYVGTWMPNDPTPPNSSLIIYGGPTVIYHPPLYNQHGYYDSSSRSDFWYYNTATNLLQIGGIRSIMTISGGVLTVTWTDSVKTIVSTLQ